MSLRRMMMFTLGGVNLVTQIINNLKSFIAATTARIGITFEAESCSVSDLNVLKDQNLLESANLILLPNNTTEGVVVPTIPIPTTDVRNLVNRSEGKTIGWFSTNVTATATSSILDPAGSQNVVRVTEVANTAQHRFGQSLANFYGYTGDQYTFSTYLKKGDGAAAPDIMQLSYGQTAFANFNISTGAVTATSSVVGASMQDAGSGWWRCIVSGSAAGPGAQYINGPTVNISFVNNNPTSSAFPSYAGATNRNVFIYGTQFELSQTASAYQSVDLIAKLPSNYAFFNSTTPGTYWINSSGSLQNVPYENLIWPSSRITSIQTGNAWPWLQTAGASPITTGFLAPDGTFTASQMNLNGTTQNRYMSYQSAGVNVNAPSFPTARIRTLIMYVKQGATGRYLGIDLRDGGAGLTYSGSATTIKVDTSNGSLASSPTSYSITYSSQSVGDGWYKICINRADAWSSLSLTSNATLDTMTNSSNGVFIWGVQVLNGVYDINTPIYNRELGFSAIRLNHSGSSCPDYLVERAGFNTLIRSEDFTSSSVWITSSMSVTSNTEIAPNGELTADTLTATATTASIRQSGVANGTQTARTFSVYLKRKTGTGDVYLNMRNTASTTATASLSTGSWTRAFVNDVALTGSYSASVGNYTVSSSIPHGYSTGDAILFDATTGTGVDASISSITVTGTNTFTFTNGTATSNGNCTIFSNTGRIILSTNGDEVYAWGAQIEAPSLISTAAGRIPSSYIPTTTAQVSRNAEQLTANFSGSASSSLYLELNRVGGSNSINLNFIYVGSDNTAGNSADGVGICGSTNSILTFSKRENNGTNTSVGNLPYTPVENTTIKVLFTTSGSFVNLWVDGALLSRTSFANPNNLKYVTIDGTGASVRLSEMVSWPTLLSRQATDSLFAYPYYNAGYTPVNYELQDIINRAYAEGFTLPSTTILSHCDTLITEMKNDGVWDVTDLFLNFAFNDTNLTNFSRINWRNPSSKLNGISSLFGGLTYQTNGFKGNGVDGYIDTSLNSGNTAPYNYTLNNAGRMLVVSEDASLSTMHYDGVLSVIRNNIMRSNTSQHKINCGTGQLATSFNMAGVGLKSIMRDSSINVRVQNTSSTLSTTQASSNLESSNQLILRSFTIYADACVSTYYMGASLTNTQISNFRTYYNTFLTNIGLTPFA